MMSSIYEEYINCNSFDIFNMKDKQFLCKKCISLAADYIASSDAIDTDLQPKQHENYIQHIFTDENT